MKKEVLFLVGPTGSGKTELSLHLARRLGTEILSVDSMQVYRGMDIGTAKPSRSERRRVRHHLIDLVSPRTSFSVYHYRRLALQALDGIFKKGLKRPQSPFAALGVGGSGLYLDALWKGFSTPPGANAAVRKALEQEADEKGLAFLHERLRELDSLRACAIHANDQRRIIRALEIAVLSQKKPSEWRTRKGGLEALGYSIRVLGIRRERSELYERVNRRVEVMFRKGFMNEVRHLKQKGLSKTAAQALGYREILQALRPGVQAASRGELIRLIQQRTRQFAKRQLTWFRRQKEIQWIDWPRGEPARRVCDKILTVLHGKG